MTEPRTTYQHRRADGSFWKTYPFEANPEAFAQLNRPREVDFLTGLPALAFDPELCPTCHQPIDLLGCYTHTNTA